MLECRRLSYPERDTYMLYVKDQPNRVLEPRPAVKKEHLETIDWLLDPQLKTFRRVLFRSEPRPAVKKEHLETIDWLLDPQLKTFSTSTEHLKKLESDRNLKEIVDCLLLAKSVNTIYRSCQAEVEELHLFNLVLCKD